MDTQSILGNLNIVQVDVSCASGAVSKTGSDVASDEVFTDGSVRYMDRKLLRPFTAARQSAIRLCRNFGTRFLGGWAIPDSNLPEVQQGLTAIIKDFEAKKAAFMVGLPAELLKWITKHPEIRKFESQFPSAAGIGSRISIHCAAYKINPGTVEGVTGTEHDGIQSAIGGLAGQVLCEVAQEARDSFSPDASKASSRARGVLLRLGHKLDSLAFIDGSLAEVGKLIRDVVKMLPTSGPLHGTDFMVYAGLMNALMEPDRIVQTARVAEASADKVSVWGVFDTAETEAAPLVEPEPPRIATELAHATASPSVTVPEPANAAVEEGHAFVPPPQQSLQPVAANWGW